MTGNWFDHKRLKQKYINNNGWCLKITGKCRSETQLVLEYSGIGLSILFGETNI